MFTHVISRLDQPGTSTLLAVFTARFYGKLMTPPHRWRVVGRGGGSARCIWLHLRHFSLLCCNNSGNIATLLANIVANLLTSLGGWLLTKLLVQCLHASLVLLCLLFLVLYVIPACARHQRQQRHIAALSIDLLSLGPTEPTALPTGTQPSHLKPQPDPHPTHGPSKSSHAERCRIAGDVHQSLLTLIYQLQPPSNTQAYTSHGS